MLRKLYKIKGYLPRFSAISQVKARKILDQFNNCYFINKNYKILNMELIYKPHLVLKCFL